MSDLPKPDINEFMHVFLTYIDRWNKTYAELNATPWYRPIRFHRLLNKLHRLTKNFEEWGKQWQD